MSTPPPNKPGAWGRLSKTIAFWMLVILVPVAFLQFSSAKNDAAPRLDVTQYEDQLDAGNIAKVTVTAGKDIVGEFKTQQTVEGKPAKKFTVKLTGQIGDRDLERLRAQKVQVSAEDARASIGALLLSILPWVVMIGIWIFIIRQMQAGGAKAFSFGKSKAKLLAGDTPKVTFADVAGCDEAKYDLREIIEFLKEPAKFTKLGGRLPKGALLVGPPGTGKTLLAKAVAGEAGRPFFSMSGSDFVEMFVGVGASRVRDLFEQGKAHAPCIIFID